MVRPLRALVLLSTVIGVLPTTLGAATLRVPGDHQTIQAAIDAASAGDTVLVAAATYHERIQLKRGVTLKSEGDQTPGDQTKGKLGLRRAEVTIIDGRFEGAEGPGVTMAEDSILDGFTVTGVGEYDHALWMKHHATQGEEQPHEQIGATGVSGITIDGIERCQVVNNIVHHIGYTGIAIVGAEGKRVSPQVLRNTCFRNMGGGIGSMKKSTAIIEENRCFENYYAGIGHNDASPLVMNNVCHSNVRAGIGISDKACPIVRGNKCFHNRRAGIGIRSGEATQPLVEDNECYENEMAGIGCRDEARPVIRRNRCFKNRMAGIGSRDGSYALIEFNECYENEMSGIGSRLGAAPVIRHNRCYRNQMAGIGAREEARPVIDDNECFENKMAGIGAQQDAEPVVRGNRCYRNKMAGIGSRLGARPIIVGNECYENEMAGIGSREGAAPIIRSNRAHHNALAGIGSRSGARPVIADNECSQNHTAGIGLRDTATTAIVIGNRCLENRLVAVGVPDGAAAFIHGNELQRTGGGAPPLVAVKGGARGVVSDNSIAGGGVAGVLVQGDVLITGNRFQGAGGRQGSAIWVWKDSSVTLTHNDVAGYRNAMNASGSKVTAVENVTREFSGASLIVKNSSATPHVHGNTAISDDPNVRVVDIDDVADATASNVLKKSADVEAVRERDIPSWPGLSQQVDGDSFHPLRQTGHVDVVEDGPWKLVATYGDTMQYQLFDVETDPGNTVDLASRLEQITFRLRGILERREADEANDASPEGREPMRQEDREER